MSEFNHNFRTSATICASIFCNKVVIVWKLVELLTTWFRKKFNFFFFFSSSHVLWCNLNCDYITKFLMWFFTPLILSSFHGTCWNMIHHIDMNTNPQFHLFKIGTFFVYHCQRFHLIYRLSYIMQEGSCIFLAKQPCASKTLNDWNHVCLKFKPTIHAYPHKPPQKLEMHFINR